MWIQTLLDAVVYAITGQGAVIGVPWSTVAPTIDLIPATSGAVPTH